MNELQIFTEDLFFWPWFKNSIKQFLGMPRGPKMVEKSLLIGLAEIGQLFFLNQKKLKYDTVCVISGVKTLAWALEQKTQGKIKRIIAGPNLVVLPSDCNGILTSVLIDTVVVPSEWVKEKYEKLAPVLQGKIFVWAAGVDLPKETLEHKKEYDFLVLSKVQGNLSLFDSIVSYLKEKKYKIHFLFYGSYKQQDYFKALERSKYFIYLSESESQGLAMFEAWARGVPALVWEKGFYKNRDFVLRGNTASPYLTSQTGLRFKDFEDFKKVFPEFISQNFQPRKYIENTFSYTMCAKKYLEIVQNAD